MKTTFRIYSWNVNGLRACEKNGFARWLRYCRGDVVGVQEVRARFEQLSDSVRAPKNWFTHIVNAERPGYSGVGLYSRQPPDEIVTSLGVDEFDSEGRLQICRFGRLWVANVYFPNGSGKNRDNSRVPFKLSFYQKLYDDLETLRHDDGRVIVMGDFNTAHRAIDLARPKNNEKTSGFLPEERREITRWINNKWTDSFRHFYPDATDHYTWWSQRFGVRQKNIGWRIDAALVSDAVLPFIKSAKVHPNVMGSDHCPISVELDRAVLDAR